jgi:hypothetical protein
MFRYILTNQLYNLEKQKSYASKIDFPCGAPNVPTIGAIVVKAAWKMLNDDEIKSGHFHKKDMLIYSPTDKNRQPLKATMGLVGLHIVHKSQDSQQWTWSTFEQVDNAPEYDDLHAGHKYSFYSPVVPKQKINTPPPPPWDPTTVEPAERRAQIVRMIPITREAKKLNDLFQNKLSRVDSKSVWQYYQLVSTQWPTIKVPNCGLDPVKERKAPVDPSAVPAPNFLGNSTLESYIQGHVPNTSSSCMECHMNATTVDGRFSDFSYLLQQAKAKTK